MARKWWGTVNLYRPSSLGGAMIHAITSQHFRIAVDGAVVTWRIGRKRGVGWVGMDGWIGTVFGDFMD